MSAKGGLADMVKEQQVDLHDKKLLPAIPYSFRPAPPQFGSTWVNSAPEEPPVDSNPVVDSLVRLLDPITQDRWPSPFVRPSVSLPVVEHLAALRRNLPSPYVIAYGLTNPVFAGPYVRDDFLDDARSTRVAHLVHVECGWKPRSLDPYSPVEETKWLQTVADSLPKKGGPRLSGLVVGVNLGQSIEIIEELIDAHLEASPLVRGVQHVAPTDSGGLPVHMASHQLSGPKVSAVFEILAERNLCFELATEFPSTVDPLDKDQVATLGALAAAFPTVPIVLTNAGFPRQARQDPDVWEEWLESLKRLAVWPSIVVKITPCLQPLYGTTTLPTVEGPRRAPPTSGEVQSVIEPHFVACWEALGARRCMVAGNFPYEKGSAGYAVVWNAIKRVVGEKLSPDERAAVLYATAARVYRLPFDGLLS